MRKHLVASETLLWAAPPRQGMFFRASDVFSIPFGVAIILFVLYWIDLSQTQDAPQIFLLMGALALLFGVYSSTATNSPRLALAPLTNYSG